MYLVCFVHQVSYCTMRDAPVGHRWAVPGTPPGITYQAPGTYPVSVEHIKCTRHDGWAVVVWYLGVEAVFLAPSPLTEFSYALLLLCAQHTDTTTLSKRLGSHGLVSHKVLVHTCGCGCSRCRRKKQKRRVWLRCQKKLLTGYRLHLVAIRKRLTSSPIVASNETLRRVNWVRSSYICIASDDLHVSVDAGPSSQVRWKSFAQVPRRRPDSASR